MHICNAYEYHCQAPTAEVWFRSVVCSCGICGRRSFIVAGFPPSVSDFPRKYHSLNNPYSYFLFTTSDYESVFLSVSPFSSSRAAGSSRQIETHAYSLLSSVQTKAMGRLFYIFSGVSQISLFGNLYTTVHAIHKFADLWLSNSTGASHSEIYILKFAPTCGTLTQDTRIYRIIHSEMRCLSR